MAKTKPVTSGINLAELSAAQLEALIIEARVKSLEQKEKEAKATLKAFKASGELDALKKEYAALGKEGKRLSRKATFDLVLPIRFTITSEGPSLGVNEFTNLFSHGNEITEDDLFSHSFTAKLTKDHNLNKNQVASLNNAIRDYAEHACDEIFDVIPEELSATYDAYAEKVSTFVGKARAAGLSLEDLA